MTIVVISGDSEWIEPSLIDVPDDASEEEIAEAIREKTGYPEDVFDELQIFKLEPFAAERLKKADWEETYGDEDLCAQNRHKAIVYAAFAKGGPVEVEALKE